MVFGGLGAFPFAKGPFPFGKGAFPFAKGAFPYAKGFDVPIGVLAGSSYPRFVSPGFTTFPPFNGFGIGPYGFMGYL